MCKPNSLACSGGVEPVQAVPAAALPKLSKWSVLSALYELSLKSPDGYVHARALAKHYPALMSDVTIRQHGNMLYQLTRPTVNLPVLVKLVDYKGSYKLTEAGIREAQKIRKANEAASPIRG